MATFGRMAEWPVGYFRAYSGWLLRHRRTVPARVTTLNAEIQRIGFIKVQYRTIQDDNGARKSEERIGITVTEGSTLEKLVQAYIANGGNPMEISSMMYPQSASVTMDSEGEASIEDDYPNSGVVFPMSADPNEPLPSDKDTGYGMNPGGIVKSSRFYATRQGVKVSPGSYDHDAIVKSMHQIRSWANQDIKEALSDLEARIIKQADLREQLVRERDEVLVQVFGGVLTGVDDMDPDLFDANLMMQNLIQDMSNTIYQTADDGSLIPAHRDDAYFPFTFPAEPADENVALAM